MHMDKLVISMNIIEHHVRLNDEDDPSQYHDHECVHDRREDRAVWHRNAAH